MTAAHYLAGAARREILFSGQNLGMLGYGRAANNVRGYSTPLYARAFCFVDGDGHPAFLVQAEICMILPEVKAALLQRLDNPDLYRPDNLLLTASHTHSAPGGYSHFPFYNFSIPGFRPTLLDSIVEALALALQAAYAGRVPARLRFGSGEFPRTDAVAFNRSLAAYNRNPEVQPLADDQTQQAVERHMWLLQVDTLDGRSIGQINWFGVHPTSIGNRNHWVSHDNKGYAAVELENTLGPGAVAIFAQQFAGDVSPNAQGRSQPDWPKGPYRDEFANARFNGQLQCRQALRILSTLGPTDELTVGPVDSALASQDFAALECDADFTGGLSGQRTSAPCHGLPFFGGSPVDGPGAPKPILRVLRWLALAARRRELKRAEKAGGAEAEAVAAKHQAQAPKLIVLESAQGRFLGLSKLTLIPGWFDPILRELKRQDRAGGLAEKPWVPSVLPLQWIRIGPLALIGFPGEITTEAGRQLRSLCQELLTPLGIQQVLVTSYANAYFGYCTTWHEYQEQQYEGGHTTFGSRTFDAFRTEYRRLLRECLKPAGARQLAAVPEQRFSPQTLAKRGAPPGR